MSEFVSPVISVVVPFYNVEEYVDACMRSLLSQDFDRYEVVCVDDGSTDNTGTLLDGYATVDPRVRVLHTENKGLSEARMECQPFSGQIFQRLRPANLNSTGLM